MTGFTANIAIWFIYNMAAILLIAVMWQWLANFFTSICRNVFMVTLLILLLIPSPVPGVELFAPTWLIVIFEWALGHGDVAWQSAEPVIYFWLLSCLATLIHHYFRRQRKN